MKWYASLFGVFIVVIIFLANSGLLDILGLINRIPYGDKAGHFLLYGILTLLIDLSFLESHPDSSPGLIILQVALVLGFFIGLEEYSQRFFETRTSDWVDLIFSYLGVTFFSLLALQKSKSRGRS
jgi:VanZ family protein